MLIDKLVVGALGANCYIIADDKVEESPAIIVDPGGEVDRIIAKIQSHALNVKYIILTHGHGDHIGAVEQLRKMTSAEVLIHHLDEPMLYDPHLNLSDTYSGPEITFHPDKTIGDDSTLSIGNIKITIIHTPGHTKGGICLYIESEKVLITGDTLFYGSIGRTDLPGGNHKDIIQSILVKLMKLPDDVVVYPGHGSSTNIKFERNKNPFLQG